MLQKCYKMLQNVTKSFGYCKEDTGSRDVMAGRGETLSETRCLWPYMALS